jgi:8-oxo-dGTP pyrophosphatase MutT (NUDIX family)
MSADAMIVHIDALDFVYAPEPWRFAQERGEEIAAYFERQRRDKPQLWNGQVLLMRQQQLAGGVLRGVFSEADFASFLAWRDWGFPPAEAWHCFGSAAVFGADSGCLLGMMGAHTSNAGMMYFPCGLPDRQDVIDGRVAFDHSVARELKEETGLDIDGFTAEPGWTMVQFGVTIALIKTVRAAESAETLRDHAQRHIAADRHSELVDIRVVRAAADLDPAMPGHVRAFLSRRWR